MVLTSAFKGQSTKAAHSSMNDKPGLAVRLCAQRLLGAVIETATSMDGMCDDMHGHPQYRALEQRDRSLVKAILSSALRHRNVIEAFLGRLLDKPLPDNAKSLRHLLHVAATQILFLDVPDHSAVDLAVEAARADKRNERFASLANALLRRMSREKDVTLPTLLANTPEGPQWLRGALLAHYGAAKTDAILAMHGVEAPVDFTVKSDPERWAERLGGFVTPTGSVRVERPDGDIALLPGYNEGAWWIQDAAAALPARLLGDIAGKRVLDLCAAPGGKTAQIAHAGADVVALDVSASRLRRLTGNLDRLGLKAQTHVGSAFDFEPEQLFDAVLVDAPCSSTGTIRRHPDVAWTKTPADVTKLAKLQFDLLSKAASFVKAGGTLVFSNCSLLEEEGEALARRALSEIPSFKLSPIGPNELPQMAGLIAPEGWVRTTPADIPTDRAQTSGMDGFFAVRFSVV